jgi:hypothetical protein
MRRPGVAARPTPPASLLEPVPFRFVPADDLRDWALATFVAEGAPLVNPVHAHLRFASLGFLWTNVGNARQGRRIVGMCELGEPQGSMGRWPRARVEQQLEEWFGQAPDFVLTFDAGYAADCSDAEFCALVEHELYHAGWKRDAFGNPAFTKDGRPKFGMRGHDIEEFVGVVRRYGAAASHVEALVQAAQQKPEIAAVHIAQACGTCQLRAA